MRVRGRMVDPFWVSIGLVVLFGTVGGVLYKLGTNQLPGITIDNLVKVEISRDTIPYLLLLFLSVGLFFYSGYSLRERIFAAEYLFAPVIFLALIMLSLSRFMIGIPLSRSGLGWLTALLTSLGVVATAIASRIVFGENFTLQTVAGIVLAVAAIFLIGEQA